MSQPQNDWMDSSQASDAFEPAALRDRADRFRRQIWWRNLREYGGSVLVVLLFGMWAVRAEGPIERLGAVLIVLAALFIAAVLGRKGTAKEPPLHVQPAVALSHFRVQLELQADLLAGVRRWYLAPFLPGFAVLTLARIVERGTTPLPVALAGAAFSAGAVILMFWVVDRLNRKAAKDLRQMARALD